MKLDELAATAEMAAVGKSISSVVIATICVAMADGGVCAQTGASAGRHILASLVAETQNSGFRPAAEFGTPSANPAGAVTYWSNPGDFGLPTTIDWTLPREFQGRAYHVADATAFCLREMVDFSLCA